jgi:hypothetical protein
MRAESESSPTFAHESYHIAGGDEQSPSRRWSAPPGTLVSVVTHSCILGV